MSEQEDFTHSESLEDLQSDRLQRDLSDEDYREELVQAIDTIDAVKRDIKAQIHHRANQSKQGGYGIDQVWLRRAKDKIDHLTRERAEIRTELGDINARIKERRRAHHGQAGDSLAQAFLKVAKSKLEPELFDELLRDAEDKADR